MTNIINKLDKFEDLESRTFKFAVSVIKLINKLPKTPGNQVVGYQEIRAATSINSNIVQGRSGVSRKDFINHYKISRKEAKESLQWLKILKVTNSVLAKEFDDLIEENDQIIKILVTSIKTALNK